MVDVADVLPLGSDWIRDLPSGLHRFIELIIAVMSNNNCSSSLVVAQRAVKQLRVEASVRRIQVRTRKRR